MNATEDLEKDNSSIHTIAIYIADEHILPYPRIAYIYSRIICNIQAINGLECIVLQKSTAKTDSNERD